MQKQELKELVKKYFSLTEMTEETNSTENIEKQEFAEATLVDGTKVTTMTDGEFEVGQELHVILEDGTHVVAPSGMHETESGITLTVDEEGKITGIARPDQSGEGSLAEDSIEEAMAEEPVAEQMSAEEETTEELKEEQLAEHGDEEVAMEIADIIEAVMEVVAPEIEALKAKMAEHEEKMESFSKAPATQSINENKFSKGTKELSFLDTKFDFKKAQLEAILNKRK